MPKQFDSSLESFPGSFELPNPVLDRHVKAWWSKAIKPLQGLGRFDFEFYDAEWLAAIELITLYGKWNIDGVAIGDLSTDSVPAAVKSWVTGEVASYIYPFLPRKALLLMSGRG